MKRQPGSLRPVLSYPTTTHCFSVFFNSSWQGGAHTPQLGCGRERYQRNPTGATEEKAEACGGVRLCARLHTGTAAALSLLGPLAKHEGRGSHILGRCGK